MKKIVLNGIILSLIYSCGSIKLPEGQTSYEVPCTGKDYRTDTKFFRASGVISSNSSASKAARRKAEASLISDIKNTISLVSDQYVKEIEDGESGELTSLTQDFSRKISSGSLQNIRIICEKTTRVTSTGMFKHYIALEMSAKDVIDDYIVSINSGKKDSIRANSEKMRAVFDEVMNK
tara:strand:- start:1623 stop:2156 length:534 start_codon:yes stop_codon:yes gene_type:complete